MCSSNPVERYIDVIVYTVKFVDIFRIKITFLSVYGLLVFFFFIKIT